MCLFLESASMVHEVFMGGRMGVEEGRRCFV